MEGGGSGGVAENLGGGARYPPLSVATARQAVKTTLSRQNARALSFSDAASVRRLQRGWPGCTGFADQTVLYDAFFLAADSSGNVYVLDRTTAYTTCYTNICSNYAYNSVCSSCARLCRFAVTVPGVCASVSGYTPDGYEKGLSVDVAGNLYVYSYRDGAFQDNKVVRIKNSVASTLTLTPPSWCLFASYWSSRFTFDASGNFYTVPYNNSGTNGMMVNRVWKYTPQSSGSTIFTGILLPVDNTSIYDGWWPTYGSGLAVDASGSVIIAGWNSLWQITPAVRRIAGCQSASGFPNPTSGTSLGFTAQLPTCPSQSSTSSTAASLATDTPIQPYALFMSPTGAPAWLEWNFTTNKRMIRVMFVPAPPPPHLCHHRSRHLRHRLCHLLHLLHRHCHRHCHRHYYYEQG